jgi:hypothetical protein
MAAMTPIPPDTELIKPLWGTVLGQARTSYGWGSVKALQFEGQGAETGVDH